ERCFPEMNGERPADRPQNHDEHCYRQNRRCRGGYEFNRGLSGDAHVVSNKTFGALVGTAHKIELITAAVLEPTIDEELIEPLSPSPLHGHARAQMHDGQEDASYQKRQVEH